MEEFKIKGGGSGNIFRQIRNRKRYREGLSESNSINLLFKKLNKP